MAKTRTKKSIDDKKISYEIKEDGYIIYLDNTAWIHQYEPYIPDPTKSYKENALAQIDELIESHESESDINSQI